MTEALPVAELRRWPIRIRELSLLRREPLTPRMLRITLGGPGHEGFESHIADEHVKLLFSDDHGLRVPTQDGERLAWPRPMPVTRDYTVRRYDREAGEIDIDVVLHGGGIASDWAATAELGSSIWVAGPPRGVHIPDGFRWQAYLGDETALPAIARRLEELPSDIRGLAAIEVEDADDELPLVHPDGVEVRWLHRRGASRRPLLDVLPRIDVPRDGRAYVWFGGEQALVKPVRRWARSAGLERHAFDLVGYWRAGAAGDEIDHHGILHAAKHLLRIDH